MTSNVGASEIAKNTGIGFTVGDETGITYEDMKNRIMGELKKVFRPEFLNRIDEVIVFHKLTREEIKEIVELLLKRIRESLADRELSLNLSDGAADLLVDRGWDPAMGARPLRRAIQRYIEDPLADEVLAQNAPPGSTVEVDREEQAEGAAEEERGVKITVIQPKEREREPVGVGAKGSEAEGGGEESSPEDSDGSGLPDEPEVLPDVPDAPPAPEDEGDKS
jgi:ATP-dependent Clp protease ATP-binding subunit ClpC